MSGDAADPAPSPALPPTSAPAGTPTLRSLSSELGSRLTPLHPSPPPAEPVTAVHVSELEDPTTFLGGGELLLTTGLALDLSPEGSRAYVQRLVDAGVAGLGVGLGPAHRAVPPTLAAACEAGGLPLLVVPAPTPFLEVSRAYWGALARRTERSLTDSVAVQRSLVDAVLSDEVPERLLQRLARHLEGWAAVLSTEARVEAAAPASAMDSAELLEKEIQRLEVVGSLSAASFAAGEETVVLHPLVVRGRVTGYLAAGTTGRLSPAHRRVVLTAVALLSLARARELERLAAAEVAGRDVAVLVDLGHREAARALAGAGGAHWPGERVHVVLVRGGDVDAVARALGDPAIGGLVVRGPALWALVPAGPGSEPASAVPARVSARVAAASPESALVVSSAVELERVARTRTALEAEPPGAPGAHHLPDREAPGQALAASAVEALRDRPELLESVVAYLRHRGHWEPAARSLGWHRNTLRHRVGRACDLLDADLDDPDLAAALWLALRADGLA
ncbi:PucR family transcriptional regulator ligand-binding domain-containing protein [Nocardioides sp. GY 10127]|uniref:PucR family transcriptional regulator n=1 Tax=Nocardioides sp. GY 10127 TaxID=2569762 RepID=UPI0010A856D4|nr:PucR family transcriptional regulator ligand-binding domain-containing protein [Nocardioides sp. GY 10127]TIC80039.1 hypothetical protein E8D37_15530 [Nocardioides sp. GY 10127]